MMKNIITPAIKHIKCHAGPRIRYGAGLIRYPVQFWIPAPVPDSDPGFAGMTALTYIVAGVITKVPSNC